MNKLAGDGCAVWVLCWWFASQWLSFTPVNTRCSLFILHHLPGHPCHIIKWYNLLVIEYTKHCTRAQGCALPSPEPPPRVAICPVEIYGAWVAIAFLLYEAAAFFKCCLRVLFEEHRIMGINTTSHLNHLSFEKVLTSCRLLHVWAWSSFMSVGRIVPSAFPWEGAVGKKKRERKRMSKPPGFSWASSETAFCTSGQSFLISCAELCSEMGSSWNEARRLKMLSVLEGGCCTSTASCLSMGVGSGIAWKGTAFVSWGQLLTVSSVTAWAK